MLTDKKLYEGFSKEEIKAIKEEVRKKYDPKIVAESYRNVRAMSEARWAEVKKEGEEVTKAIAAVMDSNPASPEVQKLVARHFVHLNNFYKPTPEMYKGLGELYASDNRFRAYYDKYRNGLADFMKEAMAIYGGSIKK
jgi:hypothetical protein